MDDPARCAVVLAFRRLLSLVRGHGINHFGVLRAYLNGRLPSVGRSCEFRGHYTILFGTPLACRVGHFLVPWYSS